MLCWESDHRRDVAPGLRCIWAKWGDECPQRSVSTTTHSQRPVLRCAVEIAPHWSLMPGMQGPCLYSINTVARHPPFCPGHWTPCVALPLLLLPAALHAQLPTLQGRQASRGPCLGRHPSQHGTRHSSKAKHSRQSTQKRALHQQSTTYRDRPRRASVYSPDCTTHRTA